MPLTIGNFSQIRDLGASMVELWNLMNSPVHEQHIYEHVTCLIGAEEDEIIAPRSLSLETLEQVSYFLFEIFNLCC